MQATLMLFIDPLMDHSGCLTPKLMLALMTNVGRGQELEGMRYLEFFVLRQESGNPAIHNYLVHL